MPRLKRCPRRPAMLFAALGLFTTDFAATAQNKGIVGIWRFSAQPDLVPMTGAAAFGWDGSLQLDGEVGQSAEVIGSGGTFECLGRYRFDGQSLQTSYFSCRSCTTALEHCFPMETQGFNGRCDVQPDHNAFTCLGLDYSRQELENRRH